LLKSCSDSLGLNFKSLLGGARHQTTRMACFDIKIHHPLEKFYPPKWSGLWYKSRLTVVSREAKKGQSDRQKQNTRQTIVCLLHKRTFSSFDIIIIVDIPRAASTFKPALKTQNLLANINYHPKDQSNRLSSLSFPAWSKLMNFVFTFFFFDGNSQFFFLNRHISLRLAILLGLLT